MSGKGRKSQVIQKKIQKKYRDLMEVHTKATNVRVQRVNVDASTGTHTMEPYQCQICLKIFTSAKNLTSHLKTHTNVRPFQCLDCGKCFTLQNTLTCHIRVHTKEKPYTCTVCFKSFTQASTLKAHVIYVHTKRFPHYCKVCSRGFISPGQKREHLLKQCGPNDR